MILSSTQNLNQVAYTFHIETQARNYLLYYITQTFANVDAFHTRVSRWRTCFPLKIGDASSCRWKDHSQASLAFCCWLHWWATFPLKVKEKLNLCSSLWDLKGVQWSTATCISISNATPRTMKPHQFSVALWLTLASSNTQNNKVFCFATEIDISLTCQWNMDLHNN